MITLQTQNRFIAPQRAQSNTFGHDEHHHHHHGHTPKEVAKDAGHFPITKILKGLKTFGLIAGTAFITHNITAGPKCERIATRQVLDSLTNGVPDSTIKRLIIDKTQANRQKVNDARASAEKLADTLGQSSNFFKDLF